jgi:hypothetical protein
VTFKEMRDLLERDRCQVQQRFELLVLAEMSLVEALQAQRLTAMGRGKGTHLQDIPALILADRSAMVSVQWWDTLEVEIKGQIRNSFTDVQFRTSEVLAIWPVTPPHEEEAEEKVCGLVNRNIWPAGNVSVNGPVESPSRGPSDRTGAQGRPTSRHLVEGEFQRRRETGAVLETLRGEAQALSNWLKTAYPDLAQMTCKTVENCIRPLYNA